MPLHYITQHRRGVQRGGEKLKKAGKRAVFQKKSWKKYANSTPQAGKRGKINY